jgi:hypothetical protein
MASTCRQALPWVPSTAVLEKVRKRHQVPTTPMKVFNLMKLKYTRVVRTRMTRTKAHQDSRELAPVRTIIVVALLAAVQAQRKIPYVANKSNIFARATSVTNSRSNLSIVTKEKLV